MTSTAGNNADYFAHEDLRDVFGAGPRVQAKIKNNEGSSATCWIERGGFILPRQCQRGNIVLFAEDERSKFVFESGRTLGLVVNIVGVTYEMAVVQRLLPVEAIYQAIESPSSNISGRKLLASTLDLHHMQRNELVLVDAYEFLRYTQIKDIVQEQEVVTKRFHTGPRVRWTASGQVYIQFPTRH
ncbi:unnamed protein product [Peniophora sp. CBMAI 1063]|nr:unnamed protein product [Peniophora sp. CBMAI 1063]